MSIQLNQRVLLLEQKLAEVNRLIAELQAKPQQGKPEDRRPVGRPRKNE
jgi:hypothetical protein